MNTRDPESVAPWFDSQFSGTRIMAILRGLGVEHTLRAATAAWDVGVRVLEIPVQSAEDLEALRAVSAAAARRGLCVGAGTVIDTEQATAVRDAGARFAVSPGVDEDVVRACLTAGLAPLPGVSTATDIQRCRRLGLTWLKAFPAAQLGPGWFTAMSGPFPEATFVATGGIRAANASEFLDANARVVSFGSSLLEPGELERMSDLLPRGDDPGADSGTRRRHT